MTMTRPVYTEQFLRERKFYLILPILALPFLTLLFWKMVVKPMEQRGRLEAEPAGLQMSLPMADLKAEQNMDKLAYYKKADQDSANWAQQIKKDPYRQHESLHQGPEPASQALLGLSGPRQGKKPRAAQLPARSAPEAKLHQKLLALDKALASAAAPSFQEKPEMPQPAAAPEIAHLEKMMQQIADQPPPAVDDPEMSRLDQMLDKLLKVQENQQGPAQSAPIGSQPQTGLPVSAAEADQQISLLAADSLPPATNAGVNTGFYGLAENGAFDQSAVLTAVIDQTQQLVSGSVIALRLTSPLYVAGSCIQENSLIYGTASVSGERLKIKITTVKAAEGILSVNLSVYDLDGLEGIYIPGALSRQIAKQQLASQVQGYQLDTDAFSAGAQAASAGIQMGKMLLSRKTRLVQVTLTEGYKVILFDQSANHP